MKYIRKTAEPSALRTWRLLQKAAPQNLVYRAIPGKTLEEVRDALLAEQGHICAYAMLRISSRDDGHIEHIVAQSKSRDTEWSIRYDNMIYCFPGKDAPRCEFGAHKKDGRSFLPGEFVSPLDPTCETRFAFGRDGSISPANRSDEAAKKTISVLELDCEALRQARKAAIDRLPIFQFTAKRLTARQAENLALKLLRLDAEGKFPAFAVALAQVATKYAKRQAVREAAVSAR